MPNNKYNKSRDGDGRNYNGRPSLIEPFDEKNHNYVMGGSSAADEFHRHNTYHPDSPSSFSQLTTATRTRGGGGDIDADYPAGEIIMIRVIAPATLQEGYEFDVLVDEEPYTVRVPRGGIQEGEVFETEYDPKQVYNYGTTTTTTTADEFGITTLRLHVYADRQIVYWRWRHNDVDVVVRLFVFIQLITGIDSSKAWAEHTRMQGINTS